MGHKLSSSSESVTPGVTCPGLRVHSVWRVALLFILAGLPALTGCRDMVTEPAPAGPASLALSVVMPEGAAVASAGLARSEGPAATPGAAFDEADRIRIELRGSRGTRVDVDRAFRSDGALTRVRVEVDVDEEEEMAIALRLLSQGTPLFEAEGSARLEPGESAEAELALAAVVARIEVAPGSVSLDALGAQATLSGQGVFATGQGVPGAIPTWESLNPEVARIVGGNRVEAVSEGETQVVARLGSLAEAMTVRVEQRAASVRVEPSEVELGVGGSATLSVVLADGNGFPVDPAGRSIQWTSSAPGVAGVDAAGRVTAQAPGSATVTAQVDGASGGAVVTVFDREPPEIITQSLPVGREGQSYLAALEATGGEAPYSWSLTDGTLPPGVSLDGSTGRIAGIPSQEGVWAFTAQVTGADGAFSTRSLSITVEAAPSGGDLGGGWVAFTWDGQEFPVLQEEEDGCTFWIDSFALDLRPDGDLRMRFDQRDICDGETSVFYAVYTGRWSIPLEGTLQVNFTFVRFYLDGELVFEMDTDFAERWDFSFQGNELVLIVTDEDETVVVEMRRGEVVLPGLQPAPDGVRPAGVEAYDVTSRNGLFSPSPFGRGRD